MPGGFMGGGGPITSSRPSAIGRNSLLPNWNAALAAQLAGTKNARVLCVGDSTTAGYNGFIAGLRAAAYARQLSDKLVGLGEVSRESSYCGDNQEGNFSIDSRWTVGSGWTISGLTAIGGQMFDNASGTTSFGFTPANNVDTAEVYYYQYSGGGTFAINVDGGASIGANVSTSGTAAFTKTTRTFTRGTHTINIQKVSGSDIYITGVVAYDSTAKEISFINAGIASQKVDVWAQNVNVYDPLNGIGLYAPDLTIINLTINDARANTNTTTYTTQMQTVINKAKLSGDVVIVSGNPCNPVQITVAQHKIYRDICVSLASTNSCPYLDLAAVFTDYATANANGYMGDDYHPSTTGYAVIANAIYGVI